MTRARRIGNFRREIFYLGFIVLLLIGGSISVFGPGGYLELKQAERNLDELRLRVRELENQNEERMRRIKDLRESPEILERHARDKGYARQDELILQLTPKLPAGPERAAP